MVKKIGAIFSAVLAMALGACEGFSKGKPNSYLVAQPQKGGGYELVMLEVDTLSDPRVLSSHVARIVEDTYFNREPHDLPTFHLRAQQGDRGWLPLDVTSGQAITIYSYLEKIWKWERSQGIPEGQVWPITVVLNARVAAHGYRIADNAFYDWGRNVIWIAPYKSANIPHSLNLGVIAHEFAHARFADIVKRVLPNKDGADGIDLTIWRGWNEGLADYFGFVMSSQAEFMGESFDASHTRGRSLFQEPRGWMDRRQLEACYQCEIPGCRSLPTEIDQAQAYLIGTEYARRLFKWGEAMGGDRPHEEIWRALVTSLEQDLKEIDQFESSLLAPDALWWKIESRLISRFGRLSRPIFKNEEGLQCVP